MERCLVVRIGAADVALLPAVLGCHVLVERLLLGGRVQRARVGCRVVGEANRAVGVAAQEGEAREADGDGRTRDFVLERVERGLSRVEVADLEARIADDGDSAEGRRVGLEQRGALCDRVLPLMQGHEVPRQAGLARRDLAGKSASALR